MLIPLVATVYSYSITLMNISICPERQLVQTGMTSTKLSLLSLGGNNKIRKHLVANPIEAQSHESKSSIVESDQAGSERVKSHCRTGQSCSPAGGPY